MVSSVAGVAFRGLPFPDLSLSPEALGVTGGGGVAGGALGTGCGGGVATSVGVTGTLTTGID